MHARKIVDPRQETQDHSFHCIEFAQSMPVRVAVKFGISCAPANSSPVIRITAKVSAQTSQR